MIMMVSHHQRKLLLLVISSLALFAVSSSASGENNNSGLRESDHRSSRENHNNYSDQQKEQQQQQQQQQQEHNIQHNIQRRQQKDRRKMLLDETFGNGTEDHEEFKSPQKRSSATATHHTFASARHYNHQQTADSQHINDSATTASSSSSISTASTTSTESSSSTTSTTASTTTTLAVTPNNHVTIQEALLPYGAQGRPNCDGRQLIVTCQPHTENACFLQLDTLGVNIVKAIKGTDYFAVCIAGNKEDSDSVVQDIFNLDLVAHVEEDPIRDLAYIKGSHRKLPDGRLLKQEEPYGLAQLQVPEFWAAYPEARGQGVTVCIVDTGLDKEHEDAPSTATGSDDIDLVNPWHEDGFHHGSHVTGIVAAVDNDIGVVGVAPEVDIFVARVFDNKGVFRASSLIEAMKECYDVGGADIINMSIGGDTSSIAESQKIDQLVLDEGVLIVSAAGNFGDEGNVISYPGAYQNTLSISALNEDERLAEFSCFNENVNLAGPGVDVLSLTGDGGYATMSGTSQASPYIAGVAALLMGQFPQAKANDIVKALSATAKDMGACGPDQVFGAGLVQTLDAAKYLEGTYEAPQDKPACVPVKVTVQMTLGKATRYDLFLKKEQKKDEASKNAKKEKDLMVFRGGLFEEGELYMDEFSLVDDGCYELIIWDENGDGFKDGDGGHYEVVFNGVQVEYSETFSGKKKSVLFGPSCSTTSSSNIQASSLALEPNKGARLR